MKMKLILTLAMVPLFSAHAASNLTVRHVGMASVEKSKNFFGFSVEIRNTGDAAYQGGVRLKPFIMPEVDVAKVDGFKPIQFDSLLVNVDIAPGATQVVSYDTNNVPNIPRARYWLGTTIFPANGIVEANIADNVTNDLMGIGEMVNVAPTPLDTQIDIYSDVLSGITVNRGMAQHVWRMSFRGTRNVSRFRAIFFVYDANRKYVYPSSYEKSLGWMDMGTDYDERGRAVQYDRYTQGPTFNDVTPGDQFLITLSNYTEEAFEYSHANNIDARKFHASYIGPKATVEIWKTFLDSQPVALQETIQLSSLYNTTVAKEWNFDRGTLPSVVAASVSSGRTSALSSTVLTGTDFMSTLGVQRFQSNLMINEVGDRAAVLEQKAVNFVFARYTPGSEPVLSASNLVAVTARSPFAPAPYTYTITNTGASTLYYKLEANNDWIFFSHEEGSVPAGESRNVTITFSPNGRVIGANAASFNLYNTSLVNKQVVNVSYDDRAP